MKQRELDNLLYWLDEGKRTFFYFKDRYVCLLLSEVTRHENDIRKLRSSSFAKLLQSPIIKTHLANCGKGILTPDTMALAWNTELLPFTISFDRWGHDRYFSQTSRSGCNLVVQLNFSNHHNLQYKKLYKPEIHAAFNYTGHPVLLENKHQTRRETLAWARVDLDLTTGEALIEEIQTDWMRQARSEYARIMKMQKAGKIGKANFSLANIANAKKYLQDVLKPYDKIWSEAMLSATINILLNDIGVDKIYYHRHVSGRIIKSVSGGSPPRSLYEALPKRFCFQESKFGPDFIESNRAFKRKRRLYPFLKWQKLDIKGEFDAQAKKQAA